MSSLLTKMDKLITIQEAILQAVSEKASTKSTDEKVMSAYHALAVYGANWSAISRETGVHRSTLKESKDPLWTQWRYYFMEVKGKGVTQLDIPTGSKSDGEIEAW
ncbi:hypothetical protein OAF74_03420 [bacterium]|nr:hypothetical protein [bacterium]